MFVRSIVIWVALSFCLAACQEAPVSCLDSLATFRAERNDYFLESDDSRFTESFKASLSRLPYFDTDEAYCVDASFESSGATATLEFPAFNGKSIAYREYGVFNFKLDGEARSLTAYKRTDLTGEKGQWILIPFRDRTNGKETYGGGRYLELTLPLASAPVLDFNRASNPLCAYLDGFTCPVPPAKNRLPIRVAAGEKNYPWGPGKND